MSWLLFPSVAPKLRRKEASSEVSVRGTRSQVGSKQSNLKQQFLPPGESLLWTSIRWLEEKTLASLVSTE